MIVGFIIIAAMAMEGSGRSTNGSSTPSGTKLQHGLDDTMLDMIRLHRLDRRCPRRESPPELKGRDHRLLVVPKDPTGDGRNLLISPERAPCSRMERVRRPSGSGSMAR